MKRLIIAGVILLCIAGLNALAMVTVNESTEKALKMVKNVETATADNRPEQAKRLKDFWQDTSEKLSVFVNHNDVDEIGRITEKMIVAAETNNESDLKCFAGEIKYILENINEEEKLTVFSIM